MYMSDEDIRDLIFKVRSKKVDATMDVIVFPPSNVGARDGQSIHSLG